MRVLRPDSWWRTCSIAIALFAAMRAWCSTAPPGAPTASSAPAASSAPTPSPAPSAASFAAVPAFRQADHVAVLTIHGDIDRITVQSLERRVEQAKREGATAIVFDIDTFGGEMDAMLDICHLIRTDAPPNSVAWINPKAFSAGAIIALACREIVVSPDATFGDAAPIRGAPGLGLIPLPPAERAKIESFILNEVIASARRNHYDENLVQAFVAVGIELWLIENRQTHERAFVGREEYKALFGEEPPGELAPVAGPVDPAAAPPAPPRLRPFNARRDEKTTAGAAAGEAEQSSAERELALARPPTRLPFTSADRGQWTLVRQVDSADRLLTVRHDEALEYGLAVQTIANDQQLAQFFGTDVKNIRRHHQVWSESLVRFLTSWPVMGLLMVIFLVCLFVELSAPGVGVFGAAAGVALAILIGAPYLAGMASWWELLLIGAGLVLVAIELFILPGFGVAGVAGVACLLVGIVGLFVSGNLASPEGQSELYTGVATTITAFFAAGLGMWFLSKYLQTIPLFDRLMLKAELATPRDEFGGPEGESGGPTGLLAAMGRPQRALQPGDAGVAETDLRPAGRASFDGRMVDVRSASGYISAGRAVRVISVGRMAIEVEDAST